MAENKQISPPDYDLNAKWDACLDIAVRRSVYSSLAGAFGGLLLFRSPVTRWAAIAFGAGIGIGSAYNECSHKFGESITTWTPPSKVQQNPVPETERHKQMLKRSFRKMVNGERIKVQAMDVFTGFQIVLSV